MAITGVHMLFYSAEFEAIREVFRDAFELDHVDDGDGWLIFAMPPAELGVHPAGPGESGHGISLMCDDIEATVAELGARGVEFAGPPEDRGYGIVAEMILPGDLVVQVYEPRHTLAIDV